MRREMPPPSPPAELPLTVHVGQRRRADGVDAAAASVGRVAADGAVGQRRRYWRRCRRRCPSAELPLTVLLVSVAVLASMPPPLPSAGVAADGAVGQRRRVMADDAAAVVAGGVAADGAVGQRRRAGADAAAVAAGPVAADGAVGQRRRGGEDAAAVDCSRSCR